MFHKPYTYQRKHFFWWEYYDIIYEDTVIRHAYSFVEAKDICAVANGAYYLGYSQGKTAAKV